MIGMIPGMDGASIAWLGVAHLLVLKIYVYECFDAL
jgi:hypothetical protein